MNRFLLILLKLNINDYRVKRELNPNIYKFCRFITETICKLNSNLIINKQIKYN
jgi:hypothetical protein